MHTIKENRHYHGLKHPTFGGCTNFRIVENKVFLVIHPGKTQAMACGRGDSTPSRSLQCSGVHVKLVKRMVYLGAVLTPQNSARDEVNRRTAGAGHSYWQLQHY